jgi:hypothetical protein
MEQSSPWEVNRQIIVKVFPGVIKHDYLLLCSQESATELYSELFEFKKKINNLLF